jgi:ribose transport system permease protein
MQTLTTDIGSPASSAHLRRKQILATLASLQGYLGLVIVFIIGAMFSPARDGVNLFLDLNNQMNILRYVAETGIIAIGMTLVILIGEIDLSVGAVLAFGATLTAYLLTDAQFGTFAALSAVLASGVLLGLINGGIVASFKIPSFVVTLSMMSFARGLARLIFGGVAIQLLSVSQGGSAPDSAFWFAERLGGLVPVPAFVMFAIAIAASLALRYTPFGRHVYAIGGNPVAARLSGVRVELTRVAVFAICSGLTAMAAFIHAIQLNQGAPNDGFSYELNAIAAVVIGGTSLHGGVGTIAGSIAGAWMLGMIDNALNLNNVESDVQLIIKAALIVLAVALQMLRQRR